LAAVLDVVQPRNSPDSFNNLKVISASCKAASVI
jgi:hypothetical protein